MLKQLFLFIFLLSLNAHSETLSRSALCAGATPLSNSDIMKKLKKQQITYSGFKIQWALLQYLSNIIDEFKIKQPLTLFFSRDIGAKKIYKTETKSGPMIMISADAEEMLFGPQLAKYREGICSSSAPNGTIEFQLSYSNTVYEQLLRALANKEQVEAHLSSKTGWRLYDPSVATEREFRLEELISIEKQIADLPAEVFKIMKIKMITRQQYGVPLPDKGAAAMYFTELQKILFGDKAFINGNDIYGEGTIIHEMGHSYWSGKPSDFQDNFRLISWKKNGNKWVAQSTSSEGFVSAYATTNPEEDFAEHFSAYVHQPEWLKTKAPQKYSFLKKYVFTDTDFFTRAPANATIFIDSKNPDTKAPWLERDINSSFSQNVLLPKNISDNYPVKLRIDGARDDISGFDEILVVLEHVENKNSKIFFKLKALGPDIKNTDLEGETIIEPAKTADGQYHVTQIALQDRATNTTFFKTDTIPSVYLRGFLGTGRRTKPELDQSRIQIKPALDIGEEKGIELTLPIAHTDDLTNLHLEWDVKSMDHPTTHVCSNSAKGYTDLPCFISKPGDPEIKIRAYFRKEYAAGQINFTSLYLHYAATKNSAEESFTYPITQPTSFFHNTGRTNTQLTDLDVNKMHLAVVKGANKLNGDTSISFQIPIITVPSEDYKIMIAIRGPSGKRILHITSKRDSYLVNGQIQFNFPLSINQEKGEYLIESLEVTTVFPRSSVPLLMDHGKPAVVKIKLIERGIRKSFKIMDDSSISLH